MRKLGLFALLLVALPGMRAEAQDFIRYYPPAGAAGLTSSGTAITSTVPILLPDGSAAAPSISFTSDPDTGLYWDTANQLNVSAAGGFGFSFRQSGIGIRSDAALSWRNGTTSGSTADVLLYRDAANTLALRNSTNAQTFNIYNTYTDASNYERGGAAWGLWSANVITIGTFPAAGTGTNRSVQFNTQSSMFFSAGLVNQWALSSNEFYPSTSDSENLGTLANQIKDFYLSRSIQGSKTKALTESSATTVATVAVPQTAGANFAGGEVRYTVYASDGTDTQVLNGSAFFSALNKAGTETCTITDDQIASEAASTGTLTCTLACAVGLTDVVGITFDCASSLTQTTLNALVRFDMQQLNTLTFP